ncbi:hypothetical protein M5K25_001189 [Dendrobium thyrsiflorum]|uniref:Uncharacterized protein n=1 Tax=Dendrobium thyrsiflorum TaxID=117978 RepID=A0ABD0VY30_DENTH
MGSDRRSERKVEVTFTSSELPLMTCFRSTSDPTGRESRRKRRVQSLHLLRSNEAEQQEDDRQT